MSKSPTQSANFTTTPNANIQTVRDVNPKEVRDRIQQISIIDVRQPDEYTGELGHIEGAQLMPLPDIGQHLETFDKKRTYVFVCRSGGRSAKACEMAQLLGHSCYNMSGGMLAWNQLGYEKSFLKAEHPNDKKNQKQG